MPGPGLWPDSPCLDQSHPQAGPPHLLVQHHVAHALSGRLPQLVMILKHVVLDVWQGPLLKDLLSGVGRVDKERPLSPL